MLNCNHGDERVKVNLPRSSSSASIQIWSKRVKPSSWWDSTSTNEKKYKQNEVVPINLLELEDFQLKFFIPLKLCLLGVVHSHSVYQYSQILGEIFHF